MAAALAGAKNEAARRRSGHAIAISVDREKLLLRTALVGLTVNVGLNLFVIPRYGGSGAAAATVAGEVVSAAMLAAGLRTAWRPATTS